MVIGNEYESITETDNESEIKILIKDGIQKLLAATTKTVEIEEVALTEFSKLIFLLFEELVTVCAPLTSKDVEDYISRAYPPEIYEQCKQKGQAVHSRKQRKRGTISRRMADGVRLKFPVETIYSLARKEWHPRGVDVQYDMIVYILAMLEHIASLILKHASALVAELSKNSSNNVKPSISLRHINIARNYREELRKLFEEERRGMVVKPALRTEPAQTYEEAVRRFMSDQEQYIKDLQIIVNKIMPIFAKPESGQTEDMVDYLFGNVKDILIFELIFRNDLEEAKEMIRQDSSFHVGVVFVEKALAEDYDVYAYYANNFTNAHQQLLKLLDNADFVAYLENAAEELGFSCPYVIDGIIPRLMKTLLKEPLYHMLHILQTIEDLYGFMSVPSSSSLDDKKNEIEYLKQTIENFARMSEIIEKIEQDIVTNSRENTPHLTPRKPGVLRAYKAFEKIENFGESYQKFSQICSEHILNGNLYTVSEKGEQKLKHCYLFDGMLLICTRDVNAKATNVRTIFKEKYMMKDLTQIKDYGIDSAQFDVIFRETELRFQARNHRDKDEWVSALLILTSRKVLHQNLELVEATELDFYSILPKSYRFNVADTDMNIRFVETKTKTYTAIPTISQGTLLKLIERVTYHKYTDLALVKQFLTTFRFFAKPRDILEYLIERYNIPLPQDLLNNTDDIEKIEMLKRLQKEYMKPVQLRVINVMRHWIDYHFDDFEKETQLVSIMMGFFDECKKKQSTMKKWISPLERTISRKQENQDRRRGDSVMDSTEPPEPVVWHMSRDPNEFSLFTLHPLEIARQATLIENAFYRSVTPQELLGSHEEKQGGNMAKMVNFSERFVFWIRQSIVETKNLEERIYIAARVFELMEYMAMYNNYTGVFEVNSALKSAEVYRLDHTMKKLLKEKEELLQKVGEWPSKNFKTYKELLKNCEPPCIPFIGIYKTKIMHTQDGNKDLKDDMINLSKFRMIADIISEIKLYQNERYLFIPEKSIQSFLRDLDPFRGRTSDVLQTDLYNLSLEIEPRDLPPKVYPRSNKDNLTIVPPKVKRSGSLISSGRTGKSDSIRRHRDSSLSDASEGGLRTPGSKNTVSPGSTRSPKEFFGYKFSASGGGVRSGTSDHDSPECSPLLAPMSSETSDDCTEPSPTPRYFTRTDSEDSPKPPIPARDPKPPPAPPLREAGTPPTPPARTMGRCKNLNNFKDKHSPATSPCDDGEYLENIFNKSTLQSPKPPPTPPKIAQIPPRSAQHSPNNIPPRSLQVSQNNNQTPLRTGQNSPTIQIPPRTGQVSPSGTPPKLPPSQPSLPKRSVSTVSSLASIIETKERDSSGTSGESLTEIHAASRFVHIDERNIPPGMVRQGPRTPTSSPKTPEQGRPKKNRPPPLSVSTSHSPVPPPIPLKSRPQSLSSPGPDRKPPPLPPKTVSRAPALPPRRTNSTGK